MSNSPSPAAPLVPFPRLVAAIAAAAADHAAGRIQVPPRTVCSVANGPDILSMLAMSPTLSVAKVVSVVRAGPGQAGGVFGRLLVLDGTGRPVGTYDAAGPTAQRTAAVSFCALQQLLPVISGPVLVVGTGVQAAAHLAALAALHPGATVTIVGRTLASAAALAESARAAGLQASAHTEATAALVGGAQVIITATSSTAPVIPDAVNDHAVILAVGNYRASGTELPYALVRRCRVYVDSLHGARHEAGEVLGAGIDPATLQALDAGVRLDRAPDRPTLFKSVGSALWDLAYAQCAWGDPAEADG